MPILEIKNVSQAMGDAELLVSYYNELNDVVANLQTTLTSIESNWQSTTADRESYVSGLKSNIARLSALAQGVKACADIIYTYSEGAGIISSNTYGG